LLQPWDVIEDAECPVNIQYVESSKLLIKVIGVVDASLLLFFGSFIAVAFALCAFSAFTAFIAFSLLLLDHGWTPSSGVGCLGSL
jgi:hypothetical protein